MNRWSFLKIYLPKYLENPHITEIVICDENGNDVKEIQASEFGTNPKLSLHVNETRLGVMRNKHKVASLANQPWICLIDSDNFAPVSYFDAFIAFLKGGKPDEKTIYAPSRTIPQQSHGGFDYRHLVEFITDKYTMKDMMRLRLGSCMMNTGNYIFSKALLLASEPSEEEEYLKDCCHAQDVVYQNYLFFTRGGGRLVLVPGMEYDHIVHDGSYWIATNKQTNFALFEGLIYNYKA
jgi:hypothetical protein